MFRMLIAIAAYGAVTFVSVSGLADDLASGNFWTDWRSPAPAGSTMAFSQEKIVTRNGGGVLSSENYGRGFSIEGEVWCEKDNDIAHVVLYADGKRSERARGQIVSGLVVMFHANRHTLQAKFYQPGEYINGKTDCGCRAHTSVSGYTRQVAQIQGHMQWPTR